MSQSLPQESSEHPPRKKFSSDFQTIDSFKKYLGLCKTPSINQGILSIGCALMAALGITIVVAGGESLLVPQHKPLRESDLTSAAAQSYILDFKISSTNAGKPISVALDAKKEEKNATTK
jgi:hypothetical protein